MIYPCVARPGTGFIHIDNLCNCFTGGSRPEFPSSSGVPIIKKSERCSLMSCQDPTLLPHHHHYVHGDYVLSDACQCPHVEFHLSYPRKKYDEN